MKPYSQFQPTAFDRKGAFLEDDRSSWLVLPCSQTRDSGPLDQSNFACALECLGGESDSVEVHRFGHWGPGWFELILIDPANPKTLKLAEQIESSLADHPVLDDEDYSRREMEEANEVWKYYRVKDRLEYIRKHRSQFDFHNFRDLLANVRGLYFSGYASELIN